MRLHGKVALITGGARGMGAVEARLFASEGAKVCIADLLTDEGPALEAEIRGSGGEALFKRLDVTQEGDWTLAVDAVEERFGKLDVLVNNAGTLSMSGIEQTTAEEWDRVFAVNAKGAFLGTKAVIPSMRRAGGGSIVNVSSIAGIVGHVGMAAYSASKSAVRLLTKCTAGEYARERIRANSVHPGPIDTDMIRPTLDSLKYNINEMPGIPLGRLGKPLEVAYGVLYLASNEASFVTGSELIIDGGITAL